MNHPTNLSSKFDHVVVLMLENRSFDNLLGYLYEDHVPEGKTFEGLQGKTIQMPVPPDANGYEQHPFIEPSQAADYHQPYPDPGEVYQHVNTQLFNEISPGNKKTEACKMVSPYNIPNPLPPKDDLMKGFVKDYINTLEALKDSKFNNPTFDQYQVIMQCFKPSQIPVLTTLAKEFAVFDHWFCSVPSQTWCNRAFWHAGTSGGNVVNPTDECGLGNIVKGLEAWVKDVWSQKNLFERMAENHISHAVYTEDIVSLTALVNGLFKDEHVVRTGKNLKRFKEDIQNGTLPQYAFIEPKFYEQHNDQHPSSSGSHFVDGRTKVGTVLLGEALIQDLYNTIRTSAYADNTLLIITYDEHGGCFDHVPPPCVDPTSAYPCPDSGTNKGQKDFRFNRLGVRVPMVMVSPWIQKNTIINETFEHTSFIKTMCERWGMQGLTERDKKAPSFNSSSLFSDAKRDLPYIAPPAIPKVEDAAYDQEPLNDLQRSILLGASYVAQQSVGFQQDAMTMDEVKEIHTVGEAVRHLNRIKQFLN
ncbi:alkaline phosphatase family protein [Yeosuana marina]|uniref:alkaline phosphatase family protein n=1 Tax=Yeosuana marina TaxID=1565536 RepID=UPI0030C89922